MLCILFGVLDTTKSDQDTHFISRIHSAGLLKKTFSQTSTSPGAPGSQLQAAGEIERLNGFLKEFLFVTKWKILAHLLEIPTPYTNATRISQLPLSIANGDTSKVPGQVPTLFPKSLSHHQGLNWCQGIKGSLVAQNQKLRISITWCLDIW